MRRATRVQHEGSQSVFVFFQAEDGIRDGHVTGVQTCALPIFDVNMDEGLLESEKVMVTFLNLMASEPDISRVPVIDRKSTRLNSSHVAISYAVFCSKKKTPRQPSPPRL